MRRSRGSICPAAADAGQCRFRWQPNSVAFWDNRSVQHYGVPDFGDQERLVERVTIAGDKPV